MDYLFNILDSFAEAGRTSNNTDGLWIAMRFAIAFILFGLLIIASILPRFLSVPLILFGAFSLWRFLSIAYDDVSITSRIFVLMGFITFTLLGVIIKNLKLEDSSSNGEDFDDFSSPKTRNNDDEKAEDEQQDFM